MPKNIQQDKTTFSAVLGVVLSSFRNERGVEQGDMAARMGLSQASYSRLESGKASFSVDQLFVACSAMGLSREELFERLLSTLSSLENNGMKVEAAVRGNSTKAKEIPQGAGAFVAGAALGALLIGALTKK